MSSPSLMGFELSAQQKRLWTLREHAPGCCAQCLLQIRGAVDGPSLERAVGIVVAEHEILRTTFRRRPGERFPLQVVAEPGEICSAVTFHTSRSDTELEALLVGHRSEPFDFVQGPLLRVAVIATPAPESFVLFTVSALCADGATLLQLASQVSAAYAAGVDGTDEGEEPLQYLSYVAWQQELAESGDEDVREGLEYWRRLEQAALTPVALPWERKEASAGFRLATYQVSIDPDVRARMEGEARRHDASLEDFLFAAWQTLLWRLTGVENFIVGKLQDGRKLDGLQEGLGPYAAHLPLRASFRDRPRFRVVLEHVRDMVRQTREWEELGPLFMAELAPPMQFDAGFDFLVWPEGWESGGCRFSLARRWVVLDRFKIHLSGADDNGRLTLELRYDLDLFDEADIERLARGLAEVLRSAAADPETLASDLETLSEAEKRCLLVELNDTGADFGEGVAIHRWFEETVARFGNDDSVIFEDQRLTYAELNGRANQLARSLRQRGAGVETTVAVLLDRSLDMVVSLLGALKAGAAYVPLDPQSPSQRLGLVLDEVKPRVVLTHAKLTEQLPARARDIVLRIDADWPEIAAQSRDNLPEEVDAGNLVYVLFTSGSTGRPKGVAVEHRQLTNYVRAISKTLEISPRTSFAMVSTFSADLGNTAIFPSLCSGGRLHIVAEERALNPELFAEYMRQAQIDVLKIVPSHLASLMATARPRDVLPRRHLVLGGEASPMALIRDIEACEQPPAITNHYGPTEATVGICTHRWRRARDRDLTRLPLGRPLANCRIYVLDRNLQPVPAGVPAELFLGGAGIARGYVARPGMTAERFLPDSITPEAGCRVYRTGDLARLLADGTLDFLGRVDHQYKIRGFRVETGEIEAVLRRHADVKDTVVVVREDGPRGGRRLVGYVVSRERRQAVPEDLQTFLREALPEYMVPPSLVTIEAVPLTANGKIDRAALPLPEEVGKAAGQIVPPDTPVEKKLVEIWSEVLGIDDIGVSHNFFELGGDSILAIQIISKAHQAGIRLNPQQIFQHQTVAELAAVAGTAVAVEPEQEAVIGVAPLTPIQARFFEGIDIDRHHWNQAVVFEVTRPLTADKLRGAYASLLAHHDALRTRFEQLDSSWSQRIAAPSLADADSFAVIDLGNLEKEACSPAFTAAAASVQASLDLSRGPVIRMVLVTGPEGWQRLFLAAHHLVVDGVSWRILISDLLAAYQQLERGDAAELPRKTTSFMKWARFLNERVRAGAFDRELDYWLSVTQSSSSSPEPRRSGNTVASACGLTVSLDAGRTSALLREVHAVYNTRIDDVLMTALALAVRRWSGSSEIELELEGHGREDLSEQIDHSRTVGWFTARYPVRLAVGDGGDAGRALKSVKEQLRRVPSKGIGYGLLRYLGAPSEVGALRSAAAPRISFNYLGQTDKAVPGSSLIRPAREFTGPSRSPAGPRLAELEINGQVVGGQLEVRWTYSEDLHDHASVQRLADGFIEELEQVIEHCRSRDTVVYTASDFPLAQLDDEKLRQLSALLEETEGVGQASSEE